MAFDLGLENKVVVITGGATGIGFATGLEFARQGAHVAICGRSEAKLAKAREAFAAEGFELFTEALDVCDAEKLYAFGDHVIEKFGRLDVWMNNAGIAITKPLLEFTEEEWNRVLDLNLNAVFHGSQYAARKMIALGNGGVILNAGSFQALMPPQCLTARPRPRSSCSAARSPRKWHPTTSAFSATYPALSARPWPSTGSTRPTRSATFPRTATASPKIWQTRSSSSPRIAPATSTASTST